MTTIESPTAERLEIEALFSCTSPEDWAAQQRNIEIEVE